MEPLIFTKERSRRGLGLPWLLPSSLLVAILAILSTAIAAPSPTRTQTRTATVTPLPPYEAPYVDFSVDRLAAGPISSSLTSFTLSDILPQRLYWNPVDRNGNGTSDGNETAPTISIRRAFADGTAETARNASFFLALDGFVRQTSYTFAANSVGSFNGLAGAYAQYSSGVAALYDPAAVAATAALQAGNIALSLVNCSLSIEAYLPPNEENSRGFVVCAVDERTSSDLSLAEHFAYRFPALPSPLSTLTPTPVPPGRGSGALRIVRFELYKWAVRLPGQRRLLRQQQGGVNLSSAASSRASSSSSSSASLLTAEEQQDERTHPHPHPNRQTSGLLEDEKRLERYYALISQQLSAGLEESSSRGDEQKKMRRRLDDDFSSLLPWHGWNPAKAREAMKERLMGGRQAEETNDGGESALSQRRRELQRSGGSLGQRFADLNLWIRLSSPPSATPMPSPSTTAVAALPTITVSPLPTGTARRQVLRIYQGTRQARSVLACYLATKITPAFRASSASVLRIFSVQPLVGSSAGGELIVIRGKGFGDPLANNDGISVKALIGDKYCDETVLIDDGTLHCVTPAGDGVGLKVSVSRGYRIASIDKLFTYNPPTVRDVPSQAAISWPSEIEPSDALVAVLAKRVENELTQTGKLTQQTLAALQSVPQLKAGLAMGSSSVISATLADAYSTQARLVATLAAIASDNSSSTSSSSSSSSSAALLSSTYTATAYQLQLLQRALSLSSSFTDASSLSDALRAALRGDPFDPGRNVLPGDLNSNAEIGIYGTNFLPASSSSSSSSASDFACRWINGDAKTFQSLSFSSETGKTTGWWTLDSIAAEEVKGVTNVVTGKASSNAYAVCPAPVAKGGVMSLELSNYGKSENWATGIEIKQVSLVFPPCNTEPEVVRLLQIQQDASNNITLAAAVRSTSNSSKALFTYNSTFSSYRLPTATIASIVKPDPTMVNWRPFEMAIPDDNYEKAAMPHVTILFFHALQLGQGFNSTSANGDVSEADARTLFASLLEGVSVDKKEELINAATVNAARNASFGSSSTSSSSNSTTSSIQWSPWDPFSTPAVAQAMLRHHPSVQLLMHSLALELKKVNNSLLWGIDAYNDDLSLLRYTRVHVESVFWPDCRQLYKLALEDGDKEAQALIAPCAASEMLFYTRLGNNKTAIDASDDVATVAKASKLDDFSHGAVTGEAGTRADLLRYARILFKKASETKQPMSLKAQEMYYPWLAFETNEEASALMAGILLRSAVKRAARAGRPVVGITGPYPYDKVMTELGALGGSHTQADAALKAAFGSRTGANSVILDPLPFRVVPSHRVHRAVATAAAEAHWTATGGNPTSVFESKIGEKAAELIRADPLAAAMMHMPFISTGVSAGGRRNADTSNRLRFPTVLKLTPPRSSSGKALAAFLAAYQGILLQRGLLSLPLATKAAFQTVSTTASSSSSSSASASSSSSSSSSAATNGTSSSSTAVKVDTNADINSLASQKIVDALHLTPTQRYFKRQMANTTLLSYVVHPSFIPANPPVGSFTCVILAVGDSYFSHPWPPASTGLFRFTLQDPSTTVRKAAAASGQSFGTIDASSSTSAYVQRSVVSANETTPDSAEANARRRGWSADPASSQLAVDAFAGFLSGYLDISLLEAQEGITTPDNALAFPDLFFPLYQTYGLSIPRVVYSPGNVPLKVVLVRPWSYLREDAYAEIAEQLDTSGAGVEWLKKTKISLYDPSFVDNISFRRPASNAVIQTAPKLSVPTRVFVVLAAPSRGAAIMDGANMAGLVDSEPPSTYSSVIVTSTEVQVEGYSYLFLGLDSLKSYLVSQPLPWEIPFSITVNYKSRSDLYDIPPSDAASVNDPFMVSRNDVFNARKKSVATPEYGGMVVDSLIAFAYPLDTWQKIERVRSMPKEALRQPPDPVTGRLTAPLVPWKGKDVPSFHLILRNSSGSPAVWYRSSYLRPTTPYGQGGFHSEESLDMRVLQALALIGGVALRDDADTLTAKQLIESAANDPIVDAWYFDYWKPPLWLKKAVITSVAAQMNLSTTTTSSATVTGSDGEPAVLTDSSNLDVSGSTSTTASSISSGDIITLGDLEEQMRPDQLARELQRTLDVIGGQLNTDQTFAGTTVLSYDGFSEELTKVKAGSAFFQLPNGMPSRVTTTTTTTTTASSSSSSTGSTTTTTTSTALQAVFQAPAAVVFGIVVPVQEDAYSDFNSYPAPDGGIEPGFLATIEAIFNDLNTDPRINPSTIIYAVLIPVPIRYRRFAFTRSGAPRLIKDRPLSSDLAYTNYLAGTFPDFIGDPDFSVDTVVEALQSAGNLVYSATGGKLTRNSISAIIGGDESWRLMTLLAALHDPRTVLALSTRGTSITDVSDGGSPLPVFAFGSTSSTLSQANVSLTRTLIVGEQPKAVTIRPNRVLRMISGEGANARALLDLIRKNQWSRFGTITVAGDGHQVLEQALLDEGAKIGLNSSMITRILVNPTTYQLTATDQASINLYHRGTGPESLSALFQQLKSHNVIFIASSSRFKCALLRGILASGLRTGLRTLLAVGAFVVDDDVCAPSGPGVPETLLNEAERLAVDSVMDGTIGLSVPAAFSNAIYNQTSTVRTYTTIVNDTDPTAVIGYNNTVKTTSVLRNLGDDRFDSRLVDGAFAKRVLQAVGAQYLREPSIEAWKKSWILLQSSDLAMVDNAAKRHAEVLNMAPTIEAIRPEAVATAASDTLWSLLAQERIFNDQVAFENTRIKLSPSAAGLRDAIYLAAVGLHLTHASGTIGGVGYTKADTMIRCLRKNFVDPSLAAGGGLNVESLALYVASDPTGVGGVMAFDDSVSNDLEATSYAIVNRRRMSSSAVVPEVYSVVNRTITYSQYAAEQERAAAGLFRRLTGDDSSSSSNDNGMAVDGDWEVPPPPPPPSPTSALVVRPAAASSGSRSALAPPPRRRLAAARTRYSWGEGAFLPERTTSQLVIVGTYTGTSDLTIGQCRPGFEQNATTFECDVCPLDTYNPKVGGRCATCPGTGDYTTFTAGQVGAKGVEMCQCPSGFFLPFTQSTETFTVFPCEPCRYSMKCSGGVTGLKIDTLPNEKGYWRGSNDTTYFDACIGVGLTGCSISSLVKPRLLTAHSKFPSMLTADQASQNINGTAGILLNGTECLEGYEGVLCATCAYGYGKGNDGVTCVHCATSGSLAMLPWVIGFGAFIGILIYLTCNTAVLPYSTASSQISKRRSANVKVMITYLQITIAVHLLRDAAELDDITVTAIFNVQSFPGVIAMAGLTLAPWECALDSRQIPIVFQLFLLYILLPIVVMFLLGFVFPYVTRCCCRMGATSKAPAAGAHEGTSGSGSAGGDASGGGRPRGKTPRRASLEMLEDERRARSVRMASVAAAARANAAASAKAPTSQALIAATATYAGVRLWTFGRVFGETIGAKAFSFTPVAVAAADDTGDSSPRGGTEGGGSKREKEDFAKTLNGARRGTLMLPPEAGTSGAAGDFTFATRATMKDWSLNVLFAIIFVSYPMIVLRSLDVLNCYTLPSGYGSYLLSDFAVACHPTWAGGLDSYAAALASGLFSASSGGNSRGTSTGIESTFQITPTPSPSPVPSPSASPLAAAGGSSSSSSSSSASSGVVAAAAAAATAAKSAANKLATAILTNDGPIAQQQNIYGSLGLLVLIICIVLIPLLILLFLLSKRDHLWLARRPMIIHPDRAQEIAVLAQKAVFDNQKWKTLVLECQSSTAGGAILDGLLQKKMVKTLTALEASRKFLIIAKAWRLRMLRARRSATKVKTLLRQLPKRRNFLSGDQEEQEAKEKELRSIEEEVVAVAKDAHTTVIALQAVTKQDKAAKTNKKKGASVATVSPGSAGTDPEELEKRVGKAARRLINHLSPPAADQGAGGGKKKEKVKQGEMHEDDEDDDMESAPPSSVEPVFSLRIGPAIDLSRLAGAAPKAPAASSPSGSSSLDPSFDGEQPRRGRLLAASAAGAGATDIDGAAAKGKKTNKSKSRSKSKSKREGRSASKSRSKSKSKSKSEDKSESRSKEPKKKRKSRSRSAAKKAAGGGAGEEPSISNPEETAIVAFDAVPSPHRRQAEEDRQYEWALATDPRANAARATLDSVSLSAADFNSEEGHLLALADGTYRYHVFVRQVIVLQRAGRLFLDKKRKAKAAVAAAAAAAAAAGKGSGADPSSPQQGGGGKTTTIAQMYAIEKARRRAVREQVAAAVRVGNKRATASTHTQARTAAAASRELTFDRGVATKYTLRVPEWYNPGAATILSPEDSTGDPKLDEAKVQAAGVLRKKIIILQTGGNFLLGIDRNKAEGAGSSSSGEAGSSNFGVSASGSSQITEPIINFLLCRPRGEVSRRSMRAVQGRKFVSFNLMQLRLLLDMLPVGPHPAAIPRSCDAKQLAARREKKRKETEAKIQRENKILAFVSAQQSVFEKLFAARAPLISAHLSEQERAALTEDLQALESKVLDDEASLQDGRRSSKARLGTNKSGAPGAGTAGTAGTAGGAGGAGAASGGKAKKSSSSGSSRKKAKKSLAESSYDRLLAYRRQVTTIDRYFNETGKLTKEQQQQLASPACPAVSFLFESLAELDPPAPPSSSSAFGALDAMGERAIAVQTALQLYCGCTYAVQKKLWDRLWGEGNSATDSDGEREAARRKSGSKMADDEELDDSDSSFALPPGMADPLSALDPAAVAGALSSVATEPWVCEMAGRAGLKQLIFDECAILIAENGQTATEAFAFVLKTRLPAVLRAQRSLGGLYCDYSPSAQYFFSWDLVRKAFLMIIATLLGAETDEDAGFIQLGTAIVAVGFLVVLAWWASPYPVIHTGVNAADPLTVYQSRDDRHLRTGRMLEAVLPRPANANSTNAAPRHQHQFSNIPPMRPDEEEEEWKAKLLRRSRMVDPAEVLFANEDNSGAIARTTQVGPKSTASRVRNTYKDWRDIGDGTLAVRRSTMPLYGLPCPEATPDPLSVAARQNRSQPRLYRWSDLFGLSFLRGDFMKPFRALPELISTPALDRWSLASLLLMIILRALSVELQSELTDRLFDITPLSTSGASKSHFYEDPDVWQLVRAGSKYTKATSMGAKVELFFRSVLPFLADLLLWATVLIFILVIGCDLLVEIVLRYKEVSNAKSFLNAAKKDAEAKQKMQGASSPKPSSPVAGGDAGDEEGGSSSSPRAAAPAPLRATQLAFASPPPPSSSVTSPSAASAVSSSKPKKGEKPTKNIGEAEAAVGSPSLASPPLATAGTTNIGSPSPAAASADISKSAAATTTTIATGAALPAPVETASASAPASASASASAAQGVVSL